MTIEEPRNQEDIDSSLMEEIAEFNRERQRIVEYRLNANAKTLEDLRVAMEELKKQSSRPGSAEAEL